MDSDSQDEKQPELDESTSDNAIKIYPLFGANSTPLVNYFHQKEHNLVLRFHTEDHSVFCIGMLDTSQTQIIPLNAEGMEVCIKLGINYFPSEKGTISLLSLG